MPVNVILGTTKRWKINKLTVILLRYGKFKIHQYLVIHFIYNEIMRQISDNPIHQQINQCITISLTIQMLYPSSNLENVITFDGKYMNFSFHSDNCYYHAEFQKITLIFTDISGKFSYGCTDLD